MFIKILNRLGGEVKLFLSFKVLTVGDSLATGTYLWPHTDIGKLATETIIVKKNKTRISWGCISHRRLSYNLSLYQNQGFKSVTQCAN